MKARVRPPIVPKILFYAIEPGSEQEQALGTTLPAAGNFMGGSAGFPAWRSAGAAGRIGRIFCGRRAVGKRNAFPAGNGVLWDGGKRGTESAGKNECSSAAGGIESGDDSA